jgi:hypothetical protein
VPQRIGKKKGEDETIKGGADFKNNGLVGFECCITRTRQHGGPINSPDNSTHLQTELTAQNLTDKNPKNMLTDK